MFSIPTWALPLLLTLVVAVLGFAYRLATRAERLTDKLETLVDDTLWPLPKYREMLFLR